MCWRHSSNTIYNGFHWMRSCVRRIFVKMRYQKGNRWSLLLVFIYKTKHCYKLINDRPIVLQIWFAYMQDIYCRIWILLLHLFIIEFICRGSDYNLIYVYHKKIRLIVSRLDVVLPIIKTFSLLRNPVQGRLNLKR